MEMTIENLKMCASVAKTAYNQIFASVSKNTFWCWGVSKVQYCFYNDMPTLMLRVSGLVHKGWVYVSLNEGKDVYEVHLLNTRKTLKESVLEVYCDELGSMIDHLIEKPVSMTDKEYAEGAMKDSAKKILA